MGEKKSRLTRRSDGAKVIKVVEVKTWVGRGTDEEPYQSITEYWSLSGELLAVRENFDQDDAVVGDLH